MKPQHRLDKLPSVWVVPMPSPNDGVGRALRASFGVASPMPDEFGALLVAIDRAKAARRG